MWGLWGQACGARPVGRRARPGRLTRGSRENTPHTLCLARGAWGWGSSLAPGPQRSPADGHEAPAAFPSPPRPVRRRCGPGGAAGAAGRVAARGPPASRHSVGDGPLGLRPSTAARARSPVLAGAAMAVLLLVPLLLLALGRGAAVPLSEFYPYGPAANGSHALPPSAASRASQESSSREVRLRVPITLYDSTYESVFVSPSLGSIGPARTSAAGCLPEPLRAVASRVTDCLQCSALGCPTVGDSTRSDT